MMKTIWNYVKKAGRIYREAMEENARLMWKYGISMR